MTKRAGSDGSQSGLCRTASRLLLIATALALPACGDAQEPFFPTARPKAAPRAPSDIDLVERVLATRREYKQSLEKLLAHYQTVGDVERAQWVEEELLQYHRINKQAYRMELDVPPPTLQAVYNIPDANELYRRAMTFKDKGWGTDYVDNSRRSEILLQDVLTRYPQSDKIGDAAYQLGDLYEGKAFKQYRRSALYFERSFQWDPNTQFDSRLRAARLYDKSLMERGKAMELYREVTLHETDARRLQEAKRRLGELTSGK